MLCCLVRNEVEKCQQSMGGKLLGPAAVVHELRTVWAGGGLGGGEGVASEPVVMGFDIGLGTTELCTVLITLWRMKNTCLRFESTGSHSLHLPAICYIQKCRLLRDMKMMQDDPTSCTSTQQSQQY